MDEEKETKETKTENTEADTGEGDKPKATTLIGEANSAAERLEKANKEKSELLAREEDLEARKKLGGGSEAGKPEEKKEETDKEYSDRIDQEVRDGKYNG